MRRETLDARKLDARRETIDESHASRLTPRRVSGLTSCALWPKVKLSEVAKGVYDGPHATPPPCDTPEYHFWGISQITPTGHVDLANPRYIAEDDYGLVEASRIIGIPVLDRLILGSPSSGGGRGYVSLQKLGVVRP